MCLLPRTFTCSSGAGAGWGAEGIGVLEQVVIGPYAPAGLRSYFDGAAG